MRCTASAIVVATVTTFGLGGCAIEKGSSPDTTAGQRLFHVARIVDGDTLELGNGQAVRLVGIDTPEAGECGFDVASDALAGHASG